MDFGNFQKSMKFRQNLIGKTEKGHLIVENQAVMRKFHIMHPPSQNECAGLIAKSKSMTRWSNWLLLTGAPLRPLPRMRLQRRPFNGRSGGRLGDYCLLEIQTVWNWRHRSSLYITLNWEASAFEGMFMKVIKILAFAACLHENILF